MAPGGKREGAGRPANWFKETMQRITSKPASIKFVEDVIDGIIVTDVATRHKIWADAADRGFGKATQQIHQTGNTGVNILQLIREAEEERGLPSSFDNE